jgi:hypothetical protein
MPERMAATGIDRGNTIFIFDFVFHLNSPHQDSRNGLGERLGGQGVMHRTLICTDYH